MEKIYLDQDGYENYLKEIEAIREKIRKNSSDISEFASDDAYGDGWHDNFAYEQAIQKENALFYELDLKLKGLTKIDVITKNTNSNIVTIDSIVTVSIDNEIEKYRLSGNTSSELNLEIPVITLNSPLGKALYNKKINESFTYSVDSNVIEGVIIDIQ